MKKTSDAIADGSICIIKVPICDLCKDPVRIVNDLRRYDCVVVMNADLVTDDGTDTVIVSNGVEPCATLICTFSEIDYVAKIYKQVSGSILDKVYKELESLTFEI